MLQNDKLSPVKSVLISLFKKEPARELIKALAGADVRLYSTGGTLDYIHQLGYKATAIEEITNYPAIFGGRVKTLHPKIFGGILYRRDHKEDIAEKQQHDIPAIDMVIVDLYPFEDTVARDASEEEAIEKIDIGGISLIRAAAKNFAHTWIVPSEDYFGDALSIIADQGIKTSLEQRKLFAGYAFEISSHYDTQIFNYLSSESQSCFKTSIKESKKLRYGENPHQDGYFYGKLEDIFSQLNGKELSYNNLLDIDGALALISEFEEPTFVIIKHTNACGVASRPTIKDAYLAALASDPVSAFGGILISNCNIDKDTAYHINELFFEVILAPSFDADSLEILKKKTNRIILEIHEPKVQPTMFRSALNGVLAQSANLDQTPVESWETVTLNGPDQKQTEDLLFANKIVKHTKSNAIVLAKDKQLIASGTGQTSRVDALKQAIIKADEFKHELAGAVMASDAFFPFPDCVEIAHQAGITSVIQPGGSVRDKQSVAYCNDHAMAMIMTGKRHFKH